MEYVDIHSHLNFKDFDEDRESVIADIKAQKISTITVGTSIETSHQAISLANEHENLFATVGIHPTDDPDAAFETHAFESLLAHPKVVAIGECGLDYGKAGTIEDALKAKQVAIFEKQVDLAIKHKKPLMIHCREAYGDVLDILESKKKEHGGKLHAHMHFFAGTTAVLRRCLDNNFTVSFTGVITFAPSYRDLVRFAPLSHIMAETDSPFVSPEPFRGKRNDPRRVKEVVEAIALIRGDDIGEVKRAMCDNAISVFGLKTAS